MQKQASRSKLIFRDSQSDIIHAGVQTADRIAQISWFVEDVFEKAANLLAEEFDECF